MSAQRQRVEVLVSPADAPDSGTVADVLGRRWGEARDAAGNIWAEALALGVPAVGTLDAARGQLVIATSLTESCLSGLGPRPEQVPVGRVLSYLYSTRASGRLFTAPSLPGRRFPDLDYRTWKWMWFRQLRDCFGGQWRWFEDHKPPADSEYSSGEPITGALEWERLRRITYTMVSAVVVARYSQGRPGEYKSWDLEGIAAERSPLTLDTAAWRAVLRLRDAYGHGSPHRKDLFSEMTWLLAPAAIGRTRYELRPWPQHAAILGRETDEALRPGSTGDLVMVLWDAASAFHDLIAPASRWHPDRHPLQDHHGPHSLSVHIERMVDGAEPEWADAIRHAASWHLPSWDDATCVPGQNQALALTAMIVYVLAAQANAPATEVSAGQVHHVLTALNLGAGCWPVSRWLAVALVECGHMPSDQGDRIAATFDELVHDHPPVPGVEPTSDGAGWAGPMLIDAVPLARGVVRRAAGRSG